MLLSEVTILGQHGWQYIPDITSPQLAHFKMGRPEIADIPADDHTIAELCPVGAIGTSPLSIDMGKCVFCGECSFAYPDKIKFTNDYKTATNERERLVIKQGDKSPIYINPAKVRAEIVKMFGRSLKLRQVSAGGDASSEMELGATSNVNFDMGRFGIDFVASPRHADGVVITGPISDNMANALQICYDALPFPKIVILAGTDAISGGIFADSPAVRREFLQKYPVDLYVPGNPIHPLTFVNGVLEMLGQLKRQP